MRKMDQSRFSCVSLGHVKDNFVSKETYDLLRSAYHVSQQTFVRVSIENERLKAEVAELKQRLSEALLDEAKLEPTEVTNEIEINAEPLDSAQGGVMPPANTLISNTPEEEESPLHTKIKRLFGNSETTIKPAYLADKTARLQRSHQQRPLDLSQTGNIGPLSKAPALVANQFLDRMKNAGDLDPLGEELLSLLVNEGLSVQVKRVTRTRPIKNRR